ncbi:hypothetical protein [Desulfosporosinus acidiphilus]|uniref:hypothetical protein n=1 Tax=Desulfosporosinus acidiphilus TaxID=885581 RepID=UPI00031AE869|nr:hypothetical protein [Desulfosporosinus acidiphilus]
MENLFTRKENAIFSSILSSGISTTGIKKSSGELGKKKSEIGKYHNLRTFIINIALD